MDGSRTRQDTDTNDVVMLVTEGKEIMPNDDVPLETASMEAAREAGLAGKKGQPGPPPPARSKDCGEMGTGEKDWFGCLWRHLHWY